MHTLRHFYFMCRCVIKLQRNTKGHCRIQVLRIILMKIALFDQVQLQFLSIIYLHESSHKIRVRPMRHTLTVIANGYLWHNLLLCCFKIICSIIKFCNQKSFSRVGHVGIPFWSGHCLLRYYIIKLTGWTGDATRVASKGDDVFLCINLVGDREKFSINQKHATDEYLTGQNNTCRLSPINGRDSPSNIFYLFRIHASLIL